MFVTLLILCVSIILLYFITYYGRFRRLIGKVPSKPGLPFIGNALEFFMYSQEKIWEAERLANKTHTIYTFWCGPIAFIATRDPDDIEKILSNTTQHLSKGYIYNLLHPWLGTGLLTSEGAKWRKRRKILTPTFHFTILKEFVDIFTEESNRMIKYLKNIEGSNIDNLMNFISHHTLNAICETAMGTLLQNMDESQQQYRQAIHEMGNVFFYRLMRPWLHLDMIFALTPMGKKQTKNLKILHKFTEKIIAERKQYHESTGGQFLKLLENDTDITETDDEAILGIKKKRLAMLDLLIAAARNNEINDSDIREEVDTFMFEGHDTVAMGLTFAILLLAEHKDVQERVRNEVKTVIHENGGKFTITTLNNLLYLERCLKESLRLYPSVPTISRVLSEDTTLQSYLIPSGAVMVIHSYDVHRDPNYWPNPDVFDPDRFLPERIQNRHPYSYIPFSAGSRNCIGQRFAMLEMKTVIASLVQNFYLEPVDHLEDLQFKKDLVMRVTRPIRVRFIPIKDLQSGVNT